MLEGWAAQQRPGFWRRPRWRIGIDAPPGRVHQRLSVARAPADVEEWTSHLVGGGLAHSTIRHYQQSVALFLEFVCDPRYGWAEVCQARFGTHPVQVFHE